MKTESKKREKVIKAINALLKDFEVVRNGYVDSISTKTKEIEKLTFARENHEKQLIDLDNKIIGYKNLVNDLVLQNKNAFDAFKPLTGTVSTNTLITNPVTSSVTKLDVENSTPTVKK